MLPVQQLSLAQRDAMNTQRKRPAVHPYVYNAKNVIIALIVLFINQFARMEFVDAKKVIISIVVYVAEEIRAL